MEEMSHEGISVLPGNPGATVLNENSTKGSDELGLGHVYFKDVEKAIIISISVPFY